MEHHYPTMSLDDICGMTLPEIAADAVLFLWATNPLLPEAFQVITAWKFTYKTSFVWDKVKPNFGYYNRANHEHLLLATRGNCTPDNAAALVDSVQSIEKTEHSRKPERFRELIDAMYPYGERVELFARGKLPAGWVGWGNEFVGGRESDGEWMPLPNGADTTATAASVN